jgi:ribosomal protein S6--L-glutamate ligase
MKIAIFSRNPKLYSTARLVEAAEAKGHTVIVVDHLKCTIELEKKTAKVYYNGSYLDDIDAIIPRIGASVTFYGTAVVRQFEMMNVFSAVES